MMKEVGVKYILNKIAVNPENDSIKYLSLLVNFLRPKSYKKEQEINHGILELLHVLKTDANLLNALNRYLGHLFANKKIHQLFSEEGIIQDNPFFSEIRKRIAYKYLPHQPDENTVEFVLTNVFYKSWDYIWINKIDNEILHEFFELLEFSSLSEIDTNSQVSKELLFALKSIVHKITGSALDNKLLRMNPEASGLDSPFIALQHEIYHYVFGLKNNRILRNSDDITYKQIHVFINQCFDFLDKAQKNKEKYGISLHLTIKILRLEEQLNRLKLLLDNFTSDPEDSTYESVLFYKKLLKAHCEKNRIIPFIKKTTNLLAFQVTQHTGETGEHYITNSKNEYWEMLKSASGGGFIVAFLCLIKVQLSFLEISQFGHGLLYSLNYSIGFIVIYLLHFTVATKQPAMTAAALARSFSDSNTNDSDKYSNFAETFARLFRSQFIAFCGNVLVAFPVALILSYIWFYIFGTPPAPDYKAQKILSEINFLVTPALFHAQIAGFYLFLSGLISGYYINNNIFNNVSLRIERHPALIFLIGENNCKKIAHIYEKHIGGLSGNFWFGVMLGMTGTIGVFLGLDIDIRHITFSSGNFAIALFSTNYNIDLNTIFWIVLTIGLIGFFNFVISFFLSLMVAMRSRDISVTEIFKMVNSVKNRFLQKPIDFFLP